MAATEKTHTFVLKEGFQVLTMPLLAEKIEHANGRFPHVQHGRLRTSGEVNKTGITVANPDGSLVAAVRHPDWIPKRIEGTNVEFGNDQSTEHIERSLLFSAPPDLVQEHGQSLIASLKIVKDINRLAMFNEGAAAGGSEPEGWGIDRNGDPYPIEDGGELQENCIEQQIEPIGNPSDFLVARSKQILKRKEKYGEAIVTDTSSLTTSSPAQTKVGTGGENGPYVTAIQDKLWSQYMNCLEPTTRQLMNNLANTFGYGNWGNMHQELGNMAYLVFSASHLSIGLPHMRVGIEAMAIPEQEAIAVADIFNSDFGTLAEMLMLSTPMVFGQTPTIMTDQGERWPRDMRAIMRYTLDTTHPGEFIMTPERYRERVAHQIETGLSHTLDRAGYMSVLTGPDGEQIERPVMHGRVRLRAATTEPMNQSGRVEFTGCSASPSIYDEAARNSLLQMMALGAYEAIAEGKHPIEYFRKEFPSMGEWENQKDLIIEADLHGFKTKKVSALIREGLQFAQRMGEKYPALKEQSELVQARLKNLWAEPVATLDEYAANPQGPFCEVVQNELRSGKSTLEVTKEIEKYQLRMANKFLETAELTS